jgi:hypothetical protein
MHVLMTVAMTAPDKHQAHQAITRHEEKTLRGHTFVVGESFGHELHAGDLHERSRCQSVADRAGDTGLLLADRGQPADGRAHGGAHGKDEARYPEPGNHAFVTYQILRAIKCRIYSEESESRI